MYLPRTNTFNFQYQHPYIARSRFQVDMGLLNPCIENDLAIFVSEDLLSTAS